MCRRTTALGRSAWPSRHTVEYLLEHLGQRVILAARWGFGALALDLLDHGDDLLDKSAVHGIKFTNCQFVVVVDHGLAPLTVALCAVVVSGLCRARDDFTVIRIT